MAQGYMSGTSWHVQYPYKKDNDEELFDIDNKNKFIMNKKKNRVKGLVENGDTVTLTSKLGTISRLICLTSNNKEDEFTRECLNKNINYSFKLNGITYTISEITKGINIPIEEKIEKEEIIEKVERNKNIKVENIKDDPKYLVYDVVKDEKGKKTIFVSQTHPKIKKK